MELRPITWALGVAALAFTSTLLGGPALLRLAGMEEAPHAASVTAVASTGRPSDNDAAPSRPAEPPTLTVAADSRGHYVVHPSIDNFRVRMLVDTGASLVALTAADARALGLRPAASEYRMQLNTANGTVRAARVNLREVRLGSILVRNIEAVVLPEGALSMSLLGTSFLGKLRGYEVQGGRMLLRG